MDQQATFLDLVARNHGRWRAIARGYAGAEAEDLFQEILLQVWRSLRSFRGDSAPGTWCYRVALNTAMGWRKASRNHRVRLPIRGDYDLARIPSPEPESWSQDALDLQRALAQLSPAGRAIVLLWLDEVSYADMAQILGVAEGVLRVRFHRIKQRLSQACQGDGDGSR